MLHFDPAISSTVRGKAPGPKPAVPDGTTLA